jgi:cell division septal protein FtsQ
MLEKQQLIIRILKILYKIGLITVFGLLVQIYTSQLGLFDDIHIEISGNQFINQDRIIKEVKPFLNQSLLSINLDKIQDGVSFLDFVETTQVSCILPSTLIIQVLERKPILLITLDNQNLFMDINGILIPAEAHSISFFPVPIITVVEEVDAEDELYLKVSELFQFILDDYPIFYDNLSEVIVENDKWTFISDSKTRILTTSNMLFTQLNALKYFEKTVYPTRELKDYSYIDIRVAEQVIVKEKYRKG